VARSRVIDNWRNLGFVFSDQSPPLGHCSSHVLLGALVSWWFKGFDVFKGLTCHSIAVENILHRLIPGQAVEKLRMHERFYLPASACVHDVGMLRGLNGDEERDLLELPDDLIRRDHHFANCFSPPSHEGTKGSWCLGDLVVRIGSKVFKLNRYTSPAISR
jgi:hypothetical protein